MVKVRIECPSCSEYKYIDITEDISEKNENSRGVFAINFSKHQICDHSFLAYVDRNWAVRDYFIADFQVKLPKLDKIDKFDIIVPENETIDFYLIKINLNANVFTYILKSIFHKKKIAIILDDLRYVTRIKDDIFNFFKFLTQDSFNTDISIINKEIYNKELKKYKKHIVFEGNEIRRKNKINIDPKKLKIEKKIVHQFMFGSDLTTSLIFLKNEIKKAYFLSTLIVDFIRDFQKKGKVNILKILEYIENLQNIKISSPYLDFLLEIVKNYFKMDIPIIYDSFLGFIQNDT